MVDIKRHLYRAAFWGHQRFFFSLKWQPKLESQTCRVRVWVTTDVLSKPLWCEIEWRGQAGSVVKSGR